MSEIFSHSDHNLIALLQIDVSYVLTLQDSDNLWWDAFATEFFEDEATLTLTFCLEDGPKRYSKFLRLFNREYVL